MAESYTPYFPFIKNFQICSYCTKYLTLSVKRKVGIIKLRKFN